MKNNLNVKIASLLAGLVLMAFNSFGQVYNYFAPSSAGGSNTGSSNTGIGAYAMDNGSNSGDYNSALGTAALISNSSGSNNSAFGFNAGYFNQTGSDNAIFGYEAGGYGSGAFNSFSQNSFFGSGSGYKTTTGGSNSAFGYQALYTNTVSANSAFGYQALYTNADGYPNDAFGYQALFSNSSGTNNNAFGYKALYSNTASGNAAFGFAALTDNTSGQYNTAVGYEALLYQGASSTTSYNTAIGMRAGEYNTTGSNNTYVGATAGQTSGNGTASNTIFVGYGASLNASTSNYAVIGNSSVSSIGGYASSGWTTYTSDVRVKKNVQANVPGLAFINKLRPVTYNLDMNQIAAITKIPDSLRLPASEAACASILCTGFIAQEVETAAKQINYDFNGNHIPKDDNSELHGLSYAQFVMPLVQAVQELSKTVDSLKAVLNKSTGQRTMQNNSSPTNAPSVGAVNTIELASGSAIIYQNAPNPFGDGTMIKYFVPEGTSNAQIVFYDEFGNQLKTFSVTETGAGQLNITSANLAPGTYSYSLMINGTVVDTKRMIKTN